VLSHITDGAERLFPGQRGIPERESRERTSAEVKSQSLLNPPMDLKREISSFVTSVRGLS